MKKKTSNVKLPCEVGDTAYYLAGESLITGIVRSFRVYTSSDVRIVVDLLRGPLMEFSMELIGKRLFFNYEEARRASDGMSEM